MAALPISIKGVILDGTRVVLAENERGEWELPGGRIEPGESPTQALTREISEECSLRVEVAPRPLDAYVFDVLSDGRSNVFIITFGCTLPGPQSFKVSDEHLSVCAWPIGQALSLPNLPDGYARSIRTWAEERLRPT